MTIIVTGQEIARKLAENPVFEALRAISPLSATLHSH
jgi:hypothetical protein